MFHSTTLKLTAWYVTIIIAICLLFSIIIYSIASTEIGARIGYLERNASARIILNQSRFESLRDTQIHEAEVSLITSLVVTNVAIWIIGGIGSYYFARRSLKPIEEAHEAQSRFVSDASHELNTPLASMKTELEVALRDNGLSQQEMRELLTSNLEEVNKLTALSRTLLQLSRLDHTQLSYEKVSLTNVAKTVIGRLDKDGKRTTFTNNKHIASLMANAPSVEELMTILLDNALKYSPPQSNIKLNLIKHKEFVGFEVTNQGDGISAEFLPYIFDRFYRVDTSRTGGEKKGFGLGLSLAKRIVELHNGELTVSSTPGETTTFRVLLPATRPTKQPAA